MSLLFEKRTILFNIVWSHILFISAAKLRLRCLNLYDMFNKWVILKQIFLIRTRILESNPKGFEYSKHTLLCLYGHNVLGRMYDINAYMFTHFFVWILLDQKKQIVDGRRNKYPFFSQCRWVTGVTDPSTKKLKTRVTGVTQQTGSNKRLGRKRWQVTLLYTLFFMTYRAKIYKRLIIRGRHPNWRVVAPMHKKKMKNRCHRHLLKIL